MKKKVDGDVLLERDEYGISTLSFTGLRHIKVCGLKSFWMGKKKSINCELLKKKKITYFYKKIIFFLIFIPTNNLFQFVPILYTPRMVIEKKIEKKKINKKKKKNEKTGSFVLRIFFNLPILCKFS